MRESLREAKRGSEILLIHRDRLRFRGNVVSIVTALLRMPLVGNKKRMPLTTGMARTHTHTNTQKHSTLIHTKTQQSPTCIYTSYYTNKHTQALKISCTHTYTHTNASTHTVLYSPPFNSQLNTHPAATSPLPTQELKTNTDIF